MNPIDPSPLESPAPRPELPWVSKQCFRLQHRALDSELKFSEVLRFRRSTRELISAPLRDVCSVFSAAASCLYTSSGSDGLHRSRRPSISAGALHPIEIMFLRSRRSARIFHFDSFTSTISVVGTSAPQKLQELWSNAEDILPDAVATLVVLVGRPAVLEAAYTHPQSLLWRDSGALLQTLSMTATSMGLGFCPLGMLGKELLDALPTSTEKLEAVGAAWLGQVK